MGRILADVLIPLRNTGGSCRARRDNGWDTSHLAGRYLRKNSRGDRRWNARLGLGIKEGRDVVLSRRHSEGPARGRGLELLRGGMWMI